MCRSERVLQFTGMDLAAWIFVRRHDTIIFNYTFWPDAYDTGYWAYAYDDLLDTVFWGESGPYSAYARLNPGEPARSPTALSSIWRACT